MSRLSDQIAEAIEAAKLSGKFEPHTVLVTVRDGLDDEDRAHLIDEALARRIKEASMRGRLDLDRADGVQPDLPFNLRPSYPLDLDGRYVKDTRDLTRIELRRVIAIREASVAADLAALAELKRAEAATSPYWDSAPEATFGTVLDLAVAAQAAA